VQPHSTTGTMASPMDPHESIALIKANLAKVLNGEILDDIVLKEMQPLKVY
jgi:tyrosyl-tRNA synthetase